jgi:hypothetical protein
MPVKKEALRASRPCERAVWDEYGGFLVRFESGADMCKNGHAAMVIPKADIAVLEAVTRQQVDMGFVHGPPT